MTQEGSRRLAAVWFADVVAYTELSAQDEHLALRVVRELKRIARVQCDAHGGRVVTFPGEDVVTVFDTADGAVRAAVGLRDAFLRSVEVRSAGVSLRVGLHLGDVAEDADGAIQGDAVKVASHIEELAEPGQVVISNVAHQLIHQRAAFELEDLGEHEVKGLGSARLYAASLSEEAEPADLKRLLQEELAPLQMLDLAAFGGMGEIYLARDPRLRRTLAVKVLRSEFVSDKQARSRFLREAQIVAGLSHPNIVSIHSVGELAEGTPYFVMDYIEGGSLEDRLNSEGPLSVRETKRIVGEVASALAAAHAKGVVHRDIKASNILFDAAAGRALVTDWGIAALDPTLGLSPETRLTQTGFLIGSPKYMSPEQLAGDDVGTETDVYSLGLLAYELLTGKGPFEATTPRALMVAHLRENPQKLSSVREGVDTEFESLIARCLGKTPSDRVTAEELASQFAPGAEDVLEWPPPGLESLKGSVFGHLLGGALTGIVVSLPILVAFLARMPWQGQGVLRNLLHGEVGVLVLVGLAYGIGAIAVAASISRERQHIVSAGGDAKRRISVNPQSRAMSLGYGWRTVLEVAMDRWGDYGNLLAGRREYAMLDATERAKVRRLKSRRTLLLAIATLALPLGVLLAAMATEWMPTGWALGIFGAGPAVLWLVVFFLPTDPVAVKRARLELTQGLESTSVHQTEVRVWHEALDKVTRGVGPGPGRSTSRRTYWMIQAPVLAIQVAVVVYMITVVVAMIVGGIAFGTAQADVASRFARMRTTAHLRLPVDTAVAAADARGLVEAIDTWDPRARPWLGDEPTLVEGDVSGLIDPEIDRAFGLQPLLVIPRALLGLSPAETSYLAGFFGDPRLEWFDQLARASRYDPASAELYPGDMLFGQRPGLRHPALLETAMSKVATAGYHIEIGDNTEAEHALRAVYSVGYLLATESNDLDEATLGRSITALALEALEGLYVGSGRYEEAALLAAPQTVFIVGEGWSEWVDRSAAVVADTTQVRAVRLATMHNLIITFECSNLEGMVLGLPPDLELLISQTAESLIRFPSDTAFINMATSSNRRLQDRVARASTEELRDLLGPTSPVPHRVLRFVGRLVRNPRFVGCVAYLDI